MTEEAARAIKVNPLFAGLTASERLLVAALFTKRQVTEGATVYRRGQLRSEFVLVHSGRLRLSHKFNGQEETLALVETGGFVGEQSLINPLETHQQSAVADLTSELYILKGSDFLKLKRQQPHLAVKLLSAILAVIADRLSHADTKLLTVYTTGKIAGLASSTQELLSLVLRVVLPTIHARQGLVALVRPDHTNAAICEAIGYRTELRGKRLAIKTDPLIGQVIRSGEELVVTRSQAKRDRHWHTLYSGAGMMVVPLQTGQTIIGAIYVADKRAGADFTINNRLLLSIVARQIASAIHEATIAREHSAQEELKRVYVQPL